MPGPGASTRVRDIGREEGAAAAAVLRAAFAADPPMNYCFAGGDLPAILRELFVFSCAVRFELDWPLYGVEEAGRLVGVAGLTMPEDAPWPPALSDAYARFTAVAGPGGTARFEQYAALAERPRPAATNHGLGVLGVLPAAQGRGHGRRLLDAVHRLAEEHPTSTGVYRDAENPASRAFYEHCGYRLLGEERLAHVAIRGIFWAASKARAAT